MGKQKSVKEKLSKYPEDWKYISMKLIHERAKNKCEKCGAEKKLPGHKKGKRVTLGVAHLDHNESNCEESNLMVMCGSCHLRYDAKDNQRRMGRRKTVPNINQLSLFTITLVLLIA